MRKTTIAPKHRPRRKPISIIGIGRSGRKDVAERAEELVRQGFIQVALARLRDKNDPVISALELRKRLGRKG